VRKLLIKFWIRISDGSFFRRKKNANFAPNINPTNKPSLKSFKFERNVKPGA